MTPKAMLTIRACDFHSFFADAKCYLLSRFVPLWDSWFVGGSCLVRKLMRIMWLVTMRLNAGAMDRWLRCKFNGLRPRGLK